MRVRSVKTAEEMFRSICSEVYNDVFPYHEYESKLDARQVDNVLFALQTLSLDLQRLALDVRGNGANAKALRQCLYEVIR